jgi:hypothetical protein
MDTWLGIGVEADASDIGIQTSQSGTGAKLNAGKKVSLASVFLLLAHPVSSASAFRNQDKSGAAVHGLIRHCPAIHRYNQEQHMSPFLVEKDGSLVPGQCSYFIADQK